MSKIPVVSQLAEVSMKWVQTSGLMRGFDGHIAKTNLKTSIKYNIQRMLHGISAHY
ncbi:MAG: hypothetical protein WA635_14305 [Gallionella sp.]